jgi:23S rRNA (pseudouridine1915-N3)-methyltransferase
MKIKVIKIGKPAAKEYESLVLIFVKRLSPQIDCESIILKAHAGVEKSQKELEKHLFRDGVKAGGQQLIVGLDENGTRFTSVAFSRFLFEKFEDSGVRAVNFVIGGPYGLSDEFKAQCDLKIRLSDFVMPSDLAWLVLWEQLYRAQAIRQGSPYHHA